MNHKVEKFKNTIIIACSLLGVMLIGLASLANSDGFHQDPHATLAEEVATLTSADAPTTSTEFVNEVEYVGISYATYTFTKVRASLDNLCELDVGGTITKDKAKGLTQFKVKFTGSLQLETWFTDLDTEQTIYSLSSDEFTLICGNYFKLTAQAETVINQVTIIYSCVEESTGHNYVEGTPVLVGEHYQRTDVCSICGHEKIINMVAKVTNLQVTHTHANDWTVTFDSAADATGYQIRVLQGETIVVPLTSIISGGVIAAQQSNGTYTIQVKALGNGSPFIDGVYSEVTFKVENWVDFSQGGVLFTGRVENDLPYGNFTLKYGDGSIYQGTLTALFLRKEGRHTYPNNMYYEGQFVNDQFEGQGKFSWSTTGNYQDASYYEGQFIGGNTVDCVGTFSWPARHNSSLGGIMYWTGVQSSMGHGAKANQQGQGAIRYLNNSVYTGGVYYNGTDYLRVGVGSNIWTVSESSGWITGGASDKNIYGFIGEFDSISHGWIYGKGVWYFTNTDGTPYGYISGTWDGGSRLGDDSTFNPATDVIESFKGAINLTPGI